CLECDAFACFCLSFPTRRSSDLMLRYVNTAPGSPAVIWWRIDASAAVALRMLIRSSPMTIKTIYIPAGGGDVDGFDGHGGAPYRSEEHTSDSSHVKNSYAVLCLK